MLGAIAGDIIGSIHEFTAAPGPDAELLTEAHHYTDDTLLTLATAECLLTDGDYAAAYRQACLDHPQQSWGLRFAAWARSEATGPYGSFGNGAAMRVAPVGWWATTDREALEEAGRSAEVTHDHPEGIKGAQATALGVYLCRCGLPMPEVRKRIERECGYDLSQPFERIRAESRYNETCQGTVPPALTIALQSESFEDVMRRCLSIDADTDTLACIAGAVAEARFGVPEWIRVEALRRLSAKQRGLVFRFEEAAG